MSNVTVRYYAAMRNQTGKDKEKLDVRLVRDVVAHVKTQYGDKIDGVLKYCSIFVNGSNVTFLDGVRTKLKDGDEVHIFPPIGGG